MHTFLAAYPLLLLLLECINNSRRTAPQFLI
jgi:hypothetical protein